MIRNIGFAGLGRMGQRMAARLVEAGYELCSYDAVPEKAAVDTSAIFLLLEALNGKG